jgi:hypothetical protein
VRIASQKLTKQYAEVTPSTGINLNSSHILDYFRQLTSSRHWDRGMDINAEEKTFYTTQYQEAFLKYVEIEYCAKHQQVPVNEPGSVQSRNFIQFAMAAVSC